MKIIEDLHKLFFKNWLIGSLGLNLILIFSVLLFQKRLPPELPLFYGLPQTAEQLANRHFLILPSAVSILVLVVNVAISQLLEDDLAQKILLLTALAISCLSLITTVKIAFLVGSF